MTLTANENEVADIYPKGAVPGGGEDKVLFGFQTFQKLFRQLSDGGKIEPGIRRSLDGRTAAIVVSRAITLSRGGNLNYVKFSWISLGVSA